MDDRLKIIEESHLRPDVGGTHWEGCEASHARCAIARLLDRVRELEQAVRNHRQAHQGTFPFMAGSHDKALWQTINDR